MWTFAVLFDVLAAETPASAKMIAKVATRERNVFRVRRIAVSPKSVIIDSSSGVMEATVERCWSRFFQRLNQPVLRFLRGHSGCMHTGLKRASDALFLAEF